MTVHQPLVALVCGGAEICVLLCHEAMALPLLTSGEC